MNKGNLEEGNERKLGEIGGWIGWHKTKKFRIEMKFQLLLASNRIP